jgi:CDP-paratose 2-epimerase
MSCIYAPRQFGIEDQGWIAHFVLSVLRGEPITIYGDGKQVRDVLHVSDLIQAYDAFLQTPSDNECVFNIGGGANHTTSLLELLSLLKSEIGDLPDITFADWREGDQKVYCSDISRLSDSMSWSPEIDFEVGISQFVDWAKSTQIL